MKIHEYQAKEIFSAYDIPVPRGKVAGSTEEAVAIAEQMKGFPVAIKAQILAGGRGKGGGVKIAHSAEEFEQKAKQILGMNLVTPQTGKEGQKVEKVLVEQGVDIDKELYLSLVFDRSSSKVAIIASMAGGMDIEEVAVKYPEKIVKVRINPLLGIQSYHARQVAFGLDLPPEARKELISMLNKLYQLYQEKDCNLLEINPLVLTKQEELLAMDAKVNFDDSALFRQKELNEYQETSEEHPLETEANKYGLNYIKMEGNVGNMVNGAGLAMATMDMIKQVGANPANFLDVGGGANAEMVENGFRIILQDENVQCVLVNIFGGILRCDVLASGVVQAAKRTGLNVPVVIRMEGTNVEEGRRILADSGLDFRLAKDLNEASQKISEFAN
ncbi:MAG: ADP-forming succinate--CoA ligase subunit beta [Thermodesulfobacteriota bacterium]